MSLQISVNEPMAASLASAVKLSGRKLKNEMAAAVNATARKVRSETNKGIRTELVIKKKDLDKVLKLSRKASPRVAVAMVRLDKSGRIPLRDFGARQTKKGVGYKISKKGGRKFIPGAFQGPRPGLMNAKWRGRVFARTGKTRLPIEQKFGPSPWGVFVKRKMGPPTAEAARAELTKQMGRRIRFNVLKATGVI